MIKEKHKKARNHQNINRMNESNRSIIHKTETGDRYAGQEN